MTRQEAIEILKCGRPFDDNPKADLDEFNLALGVAIKALKNENALIDRVLEIVEKRMSEWYEATCDNLTPIDKLVMGAMALIKEDIEQMKGSNEE